MTRFSVVFALLFLCAVTQAADLPIDYKKQIKPILATKCFACHGALKQEAGLRLDAESLIRKGGESGQVVIPGKARQSLLLKKISTKDIDERMPPQSEGEPLTAQQIALLRKWIDQGARAAKEPIPPGPRDHWAYRAPKRPSLPKPPKPGWIRNSIDAFLAARHQQAGLTPAGSVGKGVLLRRLHLDLVGLPPTRKELQAFLADRSPQSYNRVVNRLLDSPQYGERWGRHWMDVWRYSDWAGFGNEIRYSQRHIWRWRDWIVESLNSDKGYDRMILEMLAADEFAVNKPGEIRATGFLARNWYKFDRNVWLDETIEHAGKAFLAMTFKCAKCHDHKYDPISQQEYYRLRAIFEPYDVRTDRAAGQTNKTKTGLARVYDARPKAVTYFFNRGDPKQPDKAHPLAPGVPSIVGVKYQSRSIALPLTSYYPALRKSVTRAMIGQAEAAIGKAKSQLAAALQRLAKAGSSDAAKQSVALAKKKVQAAKARLASIQARLAAERAKYKQVGTAKRPDLKLLAKAAGQAERAAALANADAQLEVATRALERMQATAKKNKNAKSKRAVAAARKKVVAARQSFDKAKKAAAQPSSSYKPFGPIYPRTSTGRRLAFARWIADRRNPLTARVAVNHIWLRHFGRPIVNSVDDFGMRSPRPVLVDLLDYLAVELMENDWSMKHIHRLIVHSNAYRMASFAASTNSSAKKDADNHLFWRLNRRRMEAEVVRDSILYVAGSLDLRRGGPDINHKQGLTVPRRSLYFRHARERQMQFLQMFDPANPRECYRRQPSIRPQQAFALVNSSLTLAQSRKLAGRLIKETGKEDNDNAFVTAAFETVLSRQPSQAELTRCQQFLKLQKKQLKNPSKLKLLGKRANAVLPAADPAQRARENLVLVLFNHNDFVTIR